MADSWWVNHASGVADGVGSTILLAGAAAFVKRINRAISVQFRLSAVRKVQGAVLVCFAPLFFITSQGDPFWRAVIYLVDASVLCFLLRAIVQGYDDVGFGAAFHSTQKGVDFEKSLKIADSSLDFLGIGADKLSSTSEFTPAMERCASGGRTVRMLLWRPDHNLLKTLAKRNEVDQTEYSRKVKASLERIGRLKQEKNLDIQVRFYPVLHDKDLRFFRLMFLNDNICLWGWTDWGKHVGRDNPQVILLNQARGGARRSAYQAFHDYFNRLWEDSSVIDANLSEFIDMN